jgi:penicillin-binding protein 1C
VISNIAVQKLFTFKQLPAAASVLAIAVVIAALLADALFPPPRLPSASVLVLDRDSTVLSAFLSTDDRWRFRVNLGDVDPRLVETFIAKEDRLFYWHLGINPAAVVRAAWNNLVTGKRTSGASTITMQVARLLDPKPRTLFNKFVEVVRALQLELHYSKSTILEMYLFLVPYGSNVEGVTAASVMYFDTLPTHLSTAQVATLAVIPNRPTSLRLDGASEALRHARNVLLTRMHAIGMITTIELDEAVAEPTAINRVPTPREAWHASVRARSLAPGQPTIRTTLVKHLQQSADAILQNHMRRLRTLGITNASLVIVDNASSSYVAYIGSADVHDRRAHGFVDGVQAVRSPGSALKPLVYASAIDRGLLTPKSILEDVPLDIDGYAPLNFDQRFRGAVTLEVALATSLNVPAVHTLHRVGVENTVATMRSMRFKMFVPGRSADVGLSLVLGGCGTSLADLTAMYAAFARGGQWRPLRLLQSDSSDAGVAICSDGAAWIISDILTKHERPDLPYGIDATSRLPLVAWKTGTSYGRRDAWSFGYNSRYTVGVWAGNFDGTGNANLTGSQCAAPILFDVMRMLESVSPAGPWLQRPESVDVRLVCSATGLVPADSCHLLVADVYLPSRTATATCKHRLPYLVDAHATTSFCTSCVPSNEPTRTVWYTTLSPALLSFQRAQRLAPEPPPPHNPACPRIAAGSIAITSPLSGKDYLLERGVDTKIRCAAHPPADARTLYWYLNEAFIAHSPVGSAVFVVPAQGSNTLTCTDDLGRTSSTTFTVRTW